MFTLLTKTFTDSEIVEFYEKYGNLFSERSIFKDIIREILDFFLNMVYYFAKGITSFFENFFTLNTFFKFGGINNFYDKILIIIPIILILSIVIATIKNLAEMKANTGILKNAFLSLLIIFSLPLIMEKTGNTIDQIITSIDKKNSNNIVDEIYKDCYLDLDYNFVKKDFQNIDLKIANEMKAEDIGKIQINELLLDKRDPKHQILKYRIKNERGELEEITSNGRLIPRVLWDGYYRWKINFGYGIVFLLVTILVYFKTSLALANLYYNLAAHKVLGGLLIATDVEDDYRKKLVLKEIFTSYISIIALFLSIRIFKELSGYINVLDANLFVKIFLLLGGYVGMTKSTQLVERSFGVNNINNSTNPVSSMFRTIFLADRIGNMFNKNNNKNTNSTENENAENFEENEGYSEDYDENYNDTTENENAEDYDDFDNNSNENNDEYNSYEDKKNYGNWENEDDNSNSLDNNYDDSNYDIEDEEEGE